MIRVVSRGALIASLLVAGLLGTGCAKKVTVQDGTVVMCTAGHVISDDTKEIEVRASDVSEYGVTTKTDTCAKHVALAKVMAEAKKALDAGDLATAKTKLEQVLADDPGNADAAALLAKADGSKAPAKPSGSPAKPSDTPAKGTDEPETPTGPVMTLAPFVPDNLDGFVAQGLTADPFVLTRMYLPVDGPMQSLTIVAEQFKTPKLAQTALEQQVKAAYPSGASNATVGGKTVYFGANGAVAAVAFVSDGILVVAEGAADSGKGADIKAALIDVAKQIAR